MAVVRSCCPMGDGCCPNQHNRFIVSALLISRPSVIRWLNAPRIVAYLIAMAEEKKKFQNFSATD